MSDTEEAASQLSNKPPSKVSRKTKRKSSRKSSKKEGKKKKVEFKENSDEENSKSKLKYLAFRPWRRGRAEKTARKGSLLRVS